MVNPEFIALGEASIFRRETGEDELVVVFPTDYIDLYIYHIGKDPTHTPNMQEQQWITCLKRWKRTGQEVKAIRKLVTPHRRVKRESTKKYTGGRSMQYKQRYNR